MGIAVNCILLMLGAVVLVFGISFYLRNRHATNYTQIYILFLGIFAGIWCIDYGLTGITDNLAHAEIIRIFGVLAIDCFFIVEIFLTSRMSGAVRWFVHMSRTLIVIFSGIDFVIFSNRKVDRFVRLGNWTTWYINPEYSMARTVHSAYIMYAFVDLLIIGIIWMRTSKLKRQKMFLAALFIANFFLLFFSIPDTYLPAMGRPALATSGIGAACCTIVIWYGATQLNSFDIGLGNIVRKVFNIANTGIIVFDTGHRIAMANPYAGRLVPGVHGTGRSIGEIFRLEGKSEEELFEWLLEEADSENLVARKDERVYSVSMSAAADYYGDPYCYLCVFTDVTDEIRMIGELEVANNAKTDFLTSISHEIRTPINSVLGFDEMIKRESKESAILGYADNIYRATHHLLSIVNDLLDMGQITSGKMNLVSEKYYPAEVFQDIFVLQSMKAKEKGISFSIVNNENIPCVLIGDVVRIRQIITNFVTNAIKYTSAGSVRVNADYTERGENEIELSITISDTGIGIKEEDIPYLFDSFSRFDRVKNKDIEGTGIGLAISRSLTEMMGGTVTVESTYGKGSDFTVCIPQQVADPTPMGTYDRPLIYEEENRIRYTAPDARILVVDDNEMNRLVFAGLVKPLEIVPDVVVSGFRMLELIREKKYDIIFLDHMMPKMDGMETLRRMLEDTTHLNRETPVIVMTANVIRGAREKYLAGGFTDYIGKPIDPDELEDMIRKYLDPSLIVRAEEETPQDGNSIEEETGEGAEKLPEIPGIDWNRALTTTPDREMLLELIKTFCMSAQSEIQALDGYYHEMGIITDPDEAATDRDGLQGSETDGRTEALTEYRVKVHAMKNSAAIVGAQELSDIALRLETAASAGDMDTIRNDHAGFTDMFLRTAELLQNAVIGEDGTGRALMDDEELLSRIELIRKAMDEYDTLSLNERVMELSGYSFASEGMGTFIEELKIAVRDFDREHFNSVIDEITKCVRN